MDEYLEPTPVDRRVAAALICVILAIGVALQFWIEPAISAMYKALSVCDQLAWLRLAVDFMWVPTVVLGIWPAAVSIRTLAYGQSPPPGTRVFRRTRVHRGWRARLEAIIALALLLAIATYAIFKVRQQLDDFVEPLAVKTCRSTETS